MIASKRANYTLDVLGDLKCINARLAADVYLHLEMRASFCRAGYGARSKPMPCRRARPRGAICKEFTSCDPTFRKPAAESAIAMQPPHEGTALPTQRRVAVKGHERWFMLLRPSGRCGLVTGSSPGRLATTRMPDVRPAFLSLLSNILTARPLRLPTPARRRPPRPCPRPGRPRRTRSPKRPPCGRWHASRGVRSKVPVHRLFLGHAQLGGAGGKQARRALGTGRAGMDAIDRDPMTAQLDCQRFCHVHASTLLQPPKTRP